MREAATLCPSSPPHGAVRQLKSDGQSYEPPGCMISLGGHLRHLDSESAAGLFEVFREQHLLHVHEAGCQGR
jgi:hypothetical protein